MIINETPNKVTNATQRAIENAVGAEAAARAQAIADEVSARNAAIQQAIEQGGGGGGGSTGGKVEFSFIEYYCIELNSNWSNSSDLSYLIPEEHVKIKSITIIPLSYNDYYVNKNSFRFVDWQNEDDQLENPESRKPKITFTGSIIPEHSTAMGEARLYTITIVKYDALYSGDTVIDYYYLDDEYLNARNNPHHVTKDQVGLGNVDNTSDLNKPISTATQNALNTKANASDVNTALAVKANASDVETALAGKASTSDLAAKANASDVTDALALKADKTTVDGITEKIPTQATSSNQLADKEFVNSSINNLAAYYITKNAAGDPFGTKAELNATSTFYSGGAVRVPTRNDYTIVLADESRTSATGSSPSTRYHYNNGVWEFQYIINNTPLTAAQLAALNSGATSTNMSALLDHLAATNNPHGVTAAQVGLGNVDNTSDMDKPVSTATQSAISTAKSEAITEATMTSYGYIASHAAATNPHGITKEMLGLGVTDNTSAKFNFFPKSTYNVNECYVNGLYQIAKGSNCPSGSQYGVLLQLPYKDVTNQPQYSGQIFLPNGDDSKFTDTLFYRTANDSTWRDWHKVVATDAGGLTIIETYLGAYDTPEIPENGVYIGDPKRRKSGSQVFGNFLKITENSIDTLENTGNSIINPYTLGTFEGLLSGTLRINQEGGVILSNVFYTTPEGCVRLHLLAPMDYGYSNNSWINSEDVRGFIIGDPNATNQTETGYYMIFDANDIQCKHNTGDGYEATSIYINDYGGAVYLGKKTAIIDNGLAVIQLPGKMEYIPSTGETSTSNEWAARADACGLVIGDPYRKIVGNDSDIGKYIAIDGNDIQAKRNKGKGNFELVDLYIQDYGAYLCVPKFKCRKNAESNSDYANNDDWNNTITVANGDGYTSQVKRSAYVGRAYDERISWFPSGSTGYTCSAVGNVTISSKLTPNYLARNFSKFIITGYANGHVYSSIFDIQELTKQYNENRAQLLEIRAGDKTTNRRVSCKYYYDSSNTNSPCNIYVDTLENWDKVLFRFAN